MTTMPGTPSSSVEGPDLNPEAIERTLRELWRDMQEAGSDVTQVRMLNLIVYLAEPASPEVVATINAVAAQNPGRTITLLHEDGPPRAEATIACRVGEGQRHACGEQITLGGSAGGHALHSLAVALLQAGLPVTVWWHGPVDFDDHVFQKLAHVADRVIFDSQTWPDPLPLLPRLARAAEERAPKLRFSDLQWVQLTTWRRLVAHAFDVPAAHSLLPELEEVTVEYGGGQHLNVAGLLLVGWLAGRLGWTPGAQPMLLDDTGYVFPLRHGPDDDRQLTVALRRRDRQESICAVELRTGGDRPARFAFELTPDGQCAKTRIELPGSAPLVQISNLRTRTSAHLLNEELSFQTRDPVYRDALAAAVRLADSLES